MPGKTRSNEASRLRQRIETALQGQPITTDDLSPQDMRRLICELQMRLNELESQNRRFRTAQWARQATCTDLRPAAQLEDEVVKSNGDDDQSYQVVVEDITEWVQAISPWDAILRALRESEEKYIHLVELSPDPIVLLQEEHCQMVNSAFVQLFGYTQQEVVQGLSFLKLVQEKDKKVFQRRCQNQPAEKALPKTCRIDLVAKDGTIVPCETSAAFIHYNDQPANLVIIRDISERIQMEAVQRRRNRELALIRHASQAFSFSLDLDQVFATILEEACCLLEAESSSVWLIDPDTDELVCRHATGPQNEYVQGWRLAPGEGVAGWVARSGESLIVSDTLSDERHFKGVDQATGLTLRSIVSTPLQVRQKVIGVLQLLDQKAGHFDTADLLLLKPLAASAAVAIENARLYKQSQQEAQTRSVLLREVNHRVKNDLSAIMGLLYAERNHAGIADQPMYQSIMEDLIGRVQGLATVHNLLSNAEWAPLLLHELTQEIINGSLYYLPHHQSISVDVTPSSVRVTPGQANNLALVINELMTNTVKYGLCDRPTAHVRISIMTESKDGSDNNGETVIFQFRNDGPGYPKEVLQSKHFNVGLQLVQTLVRDCLRGELALHNDEGAVATIRFEAQSTDASPWVQSTREI